MAAAKPEVLVSRLVDQIAARFQRLPQVFEVQQSNCDIPDIMRCNRKSIIEDGGRQTGNTYISASRQDSNPISTATPRLLECINPIAIFRILCDATGSHKSKMAAAKPEVRISLLSDKIATRFQRLPPGFRGPAIQL
jgi:hypothetical protein